ncbi:FtsX-like permease family protein [Streptosporangium sp. NPDC023615]|uniref:FtsX-like permease family protein n=1 Tax=Streptosporangium sp. NPDC023615 TaxID=3154794 RepID=UPI0034279E64
MTFVLAWNNVRTNRAGSASSFAAVVMAVMLVGGSGLLLSAAGSDDELGGVTGLLTLSALVSVFVSVFVIAGMLSMHVLRQRGTWGLLRSVGMTSRQVRRLVMAEALVVAVLATATGCLLAVPYAAMTAAATRAAGIAPTGISLEIAPEEIRLLRSLGTGPRQLVRTVCWESLMATCAGVLLGTGIAAASLTAMGKALTGEPWFDYSVPQYLALVLVCVASGLTGGLAATRKARQGPLLGG